MHCCQSSLIRVWVLTLHVMKSAAVAHSCTFALLDFPTSFYVGESIVKLLCYLSLVSWIGRRRLALYWASGERCTRLYTAAMEGEPAGEGAGVGGGGSLLVNRFSPALPKAGPALSKSPALAGLCPGLVLSTDRLLGELGREAAPLVRGVWGFREGCVEKATLLWPVRRWGMPARMGLNVFLACA